MTPAPQATCPKHPGVPARGACERCGTFGCNDCLTHTTDNKLTCQACLSRGLVDLPSLSGRASLARMALFVTGGLDVAVGVSGLVVTGEEGAVHTGPFAHNLAGRQPETMLPSTGCVSFDGWSA